MSDKKCHNARSVLPSDLFKEVQSRYAGLLWVPPTTRRRLKRKADEPRNRKILKARSRGMSIRAIAERFRLSPAQIWKICFPNR